FELVSEARRKDDPPLRVEGVLVLSQEHPRAPRCPSPLPVVAVLPGPPPSATLSHHLPPRQPTPRHSAPKSAGRPPPRAPGPWLHSPPAAAASGARSSAPSARCGPAGGGMGRPPALCRADPSSPPFSPPPCSSPRAGATRNKPPPTTPPPAPRPP